MAKAEVPIPDEMHLDDFLNHLDSQGNRELAAAFSLLAKAKGIAKMELSSWEKEFESFMEMTPKETHKLIKNS